MLYDAILALVGVAVYMTFFSMGDIFKDWENAYN